MPKFLKKDNIAQDYDLNKNFIDPSGNFYGSSEDLELWTRFSNTGATDLSLKNLSFTTAGFPSFALRSVAGLKNYYALQQIHGNPASVFAGDATHWSSRIGKLATGPKSSKITCSAWIYPEAFISGRIYGSIFSIGSRDIYFARLRNNTAGGESLYLQIDDMDFVNTKWVTAEILPRDEWVHVAFTYDLENLTKSPSTNPMMYINGVPQVVNVEHAPDGPFAAILGQGVEIGDNHVSFIGQHEIAEACVWSAELSKEEIKAIYNSSVKGMKTASSGYLTNPARTIIRESDYRTGSYPQNLRIGDADFRGTTSIPFDDNKVVNFFSGKDTARIKFKKGLKSLENFALAITGSDGIHTKIYEFVSKTPEFTNEPTISGAEPVEILGQVNDEENLKFLLGRDKQVKIGSGDHLAYELSIAINSDSSLLGIKAKYEKGAVKLQYTDRKNVNAVVGVVRAGPGGGPKASSKSVYGSRLEIQQFSPEHVSVNAGTRLSKNSVHRKAGISSPNALPTLEIEKSAVLPGVADTGVHFSPGENLSPFTDSRISFKPTEFYTSGSNPKIYPGSTYKLRDKTQIKFRLKSADTHGDPVFYSTSSMVYIGATTSSFNDQVTEVQSGSGGCPGTFHPQLAGEFGTGFCYWNKKNRKWTMMPQNTFFGGHSLYKNPNFINTSSYWHPDGPRSTFLGSYAGNTRRGFNKPSYLSDNFNSVDYWKPLSTNNSAEVLEKAMRVRSTGHYTSHTDFPFGLHYKANSDHAYRMSDYISEPFVLEKITVNFKGNLGISSLTDLGTVELRNFFIMRQTREYSSSSHGYYHRTFEPTELYEEYVALAPNRYGLGQYYATGSSALAYLKSSFEEIQGGSREVISYARIGTIDENNLFKTKLSEENYEKFSKSFDALLEYDTSQKTKVGLSASFGMEITPRKTLNSPVDGDLAQADSLFRLVSKPLNIYWQYKDLPDDNYFLAAAPITTTTNILTLANQAGSDFRYRVGRRLRVGNPGTAIGYFEVTADVSSADTNINVVALTSFADIPAAAQYTLSQRSSISKTAIDRVFPGANHLPNIDSEYSSDHHLYAIDLVDRSNEYFNNSGRFLSSNAEYKEALSTVTGSLQIDNFVFKPKVRDFKEVPYVLLPEDYIVFGWENIPNVLAENCDKINADEMIDFLRDMEVTFHGSLMRAGEEYHQGTNQPLTSDGIHEAIYGSDPVDQFQVESAADYFRTSTDRIIFGSMYSPPKGLGLRGMWGSVLYNQPPTAIEHDIGRDFTLRARELAYADSQLPKLGAYLNEIDNTGLTINLSTINTNSYYGITLNNTASVGPGHSLMNNIGVFKSQAILNESTPNLPVNPFIVGGTTLFEGNRPGRFRTVKFQSGSDVLVFSGSFSRHNGVRNSYYAEIGDPITNIVTSSVYFDPLKRVPNVTNFAGGVPLIENTFFDLLYRISFDSERSLYNIFYGLPKKKDKSSGLREFPIRRVSEYGVTDDIHGLKYGIMNTSPVSPSYKFRRKTFGNFRDMLHCPPEGKFGSPFDGENSLSKHETNSPVEIRFVSRAGDFNVDPLETNSSNLSPFHTSSFPFYDGELTGRDRNHLENPFPDEVDMLVVE